MKKILLMFAAAAMCVSCDLLNLNDDDDKDPTIDPTTLQVKGTFVATPMTPGSASYVKEDAVIEMSWVDGVESEAMNINIYKAQFNEDMPEMDIAMLNVPVELSDMYGGVLFNINQASIVPFAMGEAQPSFTMTNVLGEFSDSVNPDESVDPSFDLTFNCIGHSVSFSTPRPQVD